MTAPFSSFDLSVSRFNASANPHAVCGCLMVLTGSTGSKLVASVGFQTGMSLPKTASGLSQEEGGV
jgi:hypothetical protein